MEKIEDSIKALQEVEERLYSMLTIKNLMLEGKVREDHYEKLIDIERCMTNRDIDRLRHKINVLFNQ